MTVPVQVWEPQGTAAQQQIVKDALALCDFDFGVLLPGLQAQTKRSTIPVQWADLSKTRAARSKAHAIKYRKQVLGLAWYSGKIQLDVTLQSDPRLAQEVFLSEGAHMVDFFWMTDAQRTEITRLLHPGGPDKDAWFDSGGYVTWIGEAAMGLFVTAFAPAVGVTVTQFTHPPTAPVAAALRQVLGAVTATPPPVPPTSTPPFGGLPVVPLDAWAATRKAWWTKPAKAAADAWTTWRKTNP